MSTTPGVREISEEEFAAHPLEYIDEVERTGQELRIRVPDASIVVSHVERVSRSESDDELFGRLNRMIAFMADVESPIGDGWDVEREP